jgi:pilus assembly protein CpaF
MNTGHDGSLATVHANAPIDALARIESRVVRESPAWSLAAGRDQVSRSVDVVVHVERGPHGRRIAVVAEPTPGPELAVRELVRDDRVLADLTRGRA